MMSLAPLRLVAFGLTVALLIGQQSVPVFHAGTQLVEITVTVLDKKGNAVTGLNSADFTVLDEGKPRPVEFFRFDGTPPAAPTAIATPAQSRVFTNRPELVGDTPRNVTAMVLDALNTPPQQNVEVRAQTMRYLRAIAPRTQVAIFLMAQQLRTLLDFTGDTAALRAKLAHANPGVQTASVTDYSQSVIDAEAFVNLFPPAAEDYFTAESIARTGLEVETGANAAARRLRMERSLAIMETLGTHLAGIPGRKNIVWIGAGFSMVSITGNMGTGPRGDVENFEPKVRETSQRLAQQGIILYIVDSQGVTGSSNANATSAGLLPARVHGRFAPQMDTEALSNDPRPAMELMATITGGRYLSNTNDLAAGFKQTATDIQGSYTLGFYRSGDPDDKWHKLTVRVKGSGLSVRHREGYLATYVSPRPVAWTTETWRAAFRDPIGQTIIPLTATCERTPSGELSLILSVDPRAIQFHPDGENLKADLEVGIAARAADGSAYTNRSALPVAIVAANWEETRRQGVRYQKQWKPMADTTSLRVIVHDLGSGQSGSLEIPLR